MQNRASAALFVRADAMKLAKIPRVANYETTVTIRFEDADPAGVVFYPRAIALAHGAVEDLIRQTEFGWHGWFENREWVAPVRRAEADFLAPIHAGEILRARVAVEKLGDTSCTIGVEFIGSAGDVRARIRTVHVLVDRKTGKPIALRTEIRRALEAFGD